MAYHSLILEVCATPGFLPWFSFLLDFLFMDCFDTVGPTTLLGFFNGLQVSVYVGLEIPFDE